MLRYLEKIFETPMGQCYRPFLRTELEQMPCRDMFFVNPDAQWEMQERTLKEEESFAHQIGKQQIVCYLQENKKKTGMLPHSFAYGNGVNQICTASPLPEEENVYYTRLGYFLGEGRMPVNVALFEPQNEECRLFSKHGIPYHIVSNQSMAKYGFSKKGRIGCGKCEYTHLVLPADATYGKVMTTYVDRFVETGGKLLKLEELAPSASRWKSTCTFGEIEREQRYGCGNPETMLYSSYHCLNEMEYLYVTNPSAKATYTQTFLFREQVHSFLRLNLMDFSSTQIPLQVTLGPGEEAILVPYGKKME